jgi:hypothetical protein
MDTETLIKVVAMLEKKVWNLTREYSDLQLFMIAHNYSSAEIKEAKEKHDIERKALVDFMNQLQKTIAVEITTEDFSHLFKEGE